MLNKFYSQMTVVINFYSFAMLLHFRPMYAAFGFTDSQPILIGLIIVLMHILIPINEVRQHFFLSLNVIFLNMN